MIILTLRKQGTGGNWLLLAPKGHSLVEFHRCADKEAAMNAAKAWASSWCGYEIRFEDEQDA